MHRSRRRMDCRPVLARLRAITPSRVQHDLRCGGSHNFGWDRLCCRDQSRTSQLIAREFSQEEATGMQCWAAECCVASAWRLTCRIPACSCNRIPILVNLSPQTAAALCCAQMAHPWTDTWLTASYPVPPLPSPEFVKTTNSEPLTAFP